MYPPASEWSIVVWFDTQDQAKIAAKALLGMMPRAFQFTASTASGDVVWRERGEDYGAQSVRL